MFNYFPYSSHPSSPHDAEYLRALAEERAARQQFVAAQRAQEEARARAARARATRQAYSSPYNSYLSDLENHDLGLEDRGFGLPMMPTGFGFDPYASARQRALVEEQRRRELLEEQQRNEMLELEREKERERLEEERVRRLLHEERLREEEERRNRIEEEQTLEEEQRRDLDSQRRRTRPHDFTRSDLEPLLRAFGLRPPLSDEEEEVTLIFTYREFGSSNLCQTPRLGRPFARARTMSPPHQRMAPRNLQRPQQAQPTKRPVSAPRAEMRPPPTAKEPGRVPPPSPSPKAKVTVSASPAEIAAAKKIQAAYRAHATKENALKLVSRLRYRFAHLKSSFTLPTTLDYAPGDKAPHVTVTVDPSAKLPALFPNVEEEEAAGGVPKLAYTPINAQVHTYEEELNCLLSALDAVESLGDVGVREARRELVRMVEREAERVEQWKGVVWRWWAERRKQDTGAKIDVTAPLSVDSERDDSKMVVEPTVTSAESTKPVQEAPGVVETAPTRASQWPVDIEVTEVSPDLPSMSDDSHVHIVPEHHTLEPIIPEVTEEEEREAEHEMQVEQQRPATPALSHDLSEAEVEMEVETEEARTPPAREAELHTPNIVVTPPVEAKAKAEVPPEPEAKQRAEPLFALVDREWKEVDTYDMF
ncbi:hypothetical protein A0H81_05456 [Grifola frondosa]|uniref:BAG domain-containing protein n=1 Tax=Grifola frondosa TaxID=5627 RepID=A0A1C7MDM7_GRIFR|nr:hypothetical protein A0H81_05456 [Grifola frondosa]